jgi:1,4-alpha-glucan branching enzyme
MISRSDTKKTTAERWPKSRRSPVMTEGPPMETRNQDRIVSWEKSAGAVQSFFFAAPAAMCVQLAGDFTHWQREPITMRRGVDGIWRAKIMLPRGTHHYRFIVDGEWKDDPECTLRVRNSLGTENSVREVA